MLQSTKTAWKRILMAIHEDCRDDPCPPPHSHLVHPCSGDRNDSPCCSTAPGHRSTKGEKNRWNIRGQSLTVKNVSIFCWWWLFCFWLLPIYSQKNQGLYKVPIQSLGDLQGTTCPNFRWASPSGDWGASRRAIFWGTVPGFSNLT